MKTLSTINMYPSNATLFDTEDNSYHIDFDGIRGEFTAEEWLNDDIIAQFDKKSQDIIIDEFRTYEILK
jgi:hypothetical protein